MKNKIGKILISSMILTALSASIVYSADFYRAGWTAYKKGDYNKAAIYFKQALKEYPSNNSYRYLYAQTLLMKKRYKEAQIHFQKIIANAPYSKEALKSSKAIALIQEYYESKNYNNYSTSVNSKENLENKLKNNTINGIGENYIFFATNNGKVTRWNSRKMPVRIFIPKDKKYSDIIKDAVNQWVSSTDGNLSYMVASTPSRADISVELHDHVDVAKTSKKSGYVSGLTIPSYNGQILKSVKIKIGTKDMAQNTLQDVDIFNTTLHEFGHAFGIYGHSDNKNDVMFGVAQTVGKYRISLTERDKNTMKLLYRLDPDISNFTKIPTKKSKVNNLILGDNTFRKDQKIKEAQDYVKTIPSHPKSWSSLGSAYADANKYPEAIKYFKKALKIDPNYEEALAGLAAVYTNQHDHPNAMTIYKKLVKINPGNMGFTYNYVQLLNESNQYNESYLVLNNLLASNPKAKANKDIIKLISYVKSKKQKNK